jgi:hypothetical protein
MLIEGAFDSCNLAKMNAALDRVCQGTANGEDHLVRTRVAKQIIKCARRGKTTLSELTAAGQRGLIGIVPTEIGLASGREADHDRYRDAKALKLTKALHNL